MTFPSFTRALHALAAAFAVTLAPGSATAEDAHDPAAELASFKLPPGFEANLFASEKDGVIKPIQIRWDTRGRLWVIGSTTYPQLKPGEEPNDKVLVLEDRDGDGVCDKTTVFADGLMIPTGIEIAPTNNRGRAGVAPDGTPIVEDGLAAAGKAGVPPPPSNIGTRSSSSDGPGGTPGPAGETPALPRNPDAPTTPPSRAAPVSQLSTLNSQHSTFPSACYVGEGPKLWLITDTDGDGKADKKQVVLRGFGTGDNHQNINSFRWSPGGELFFSQGLHAHARIETPHGIVPLDEAGFWRFRPREQRLDSFYGGPAEPQNPWGFVWTDWGQMLMVAGNNGGIYYPLPEMIRGHRYGKRDQIWENARGRKTSGPDIVGTAHLPDEWQGRFITGGYINNAVWTMAIEDDGAGFKLTDREPLITSTDGSFRPVDVKIGPDGAIYICDWYNPIIGHYQASFRHPDRDKTHGRIWRVTYKGRPLVKPPQIAGAPVGELFENLKSNERWVREQTKRELAGRPTEEVIPALREWWPQLPGRAGVPPAEGGILPPSSKIGARPSLKGPGETPAPAGETPALPGNLERTLVEALGVFESHDAPEYPLVIALAGSSDANVRARTVAVAGKWARSPSDGMQDLLIKLAGDASPRVRLGAIVAAAEQRSESGVFPVLFADGVVPGIPRGRDKFIDLALHSAASALRPFWESMPRPAVLSTVPQPTDLPHWRAEWNERLALLATGKSAAPPALAPKQPVRPASAIPATGKLRATPEFIADLVREVKESGDAKHGAEVFRRAELACTTCHSIADQGGKIGPALDNIGSGQPLDFIIGAVLEPQREIKESYEAIQLTAKDGRTAIGYIAARDPAGSTIRDPATGLETKFAASDIAEQKLLGSFMPAGLVDNLPRADLRDLFRYLSELGKAKP